MFRRSAEDSAGRALAALYREHAASTYRFALHLCGSRDDAEDLTQTAFLEAHRRLLAGEELVSPRAWLASVVRTRAANLRRDRHDIAASDQLEHLARAVDPVETSDEMQRVRVVLWSLPEAQHQAFVLRHWCDLSNREIARLLDTTEPAVESLLVRARRAIGGAEHLPPACMETRGRLVQGLPETPGVSSHLAQCRGCRTAGDRLARAAGIAAVLALAPRVSVAHSLAATVPGFSAAAATSASSGLAGAAATKSLIAKALVTTVAVGATATAIHTGVLRSAFFHHRASTIVSERAPIRPTAATASHPNGALTAEPTTVPVDPTHRNAQDAASDRSRRSGDAGSGQDSNRTDQQQPAQPGGNDGGSSPGQNQQGDQQGQSGGSSSGTSGDSGANSSDGNTGGGDGGSTTGGGGGPNAGGSTSGGQGSSTDSQQ